MDYSINQRLREFCYDQRIIEAELARRINLSRQTINGWWTDQRIFPLKHLYLLKQKFPTLNEEWLVMGKGSMYLNNTNPVNPASKSNENEEDYYILKIKYELMVKEYDNMKIENKQLHQEIGRLNYLIDQIRDNAQSAIFGNTPPPRPKKTATPPQKNKPKNKPKNEQTAAPSPNSPVAKTGHNSHE